MIHVFDFNVQGFSHQPFNSALLEILRIGCPDDAIAMHGNDSHLAALASSGLPANVALHPVRGPGQTPADIAAAIRAASREGAGARNILILGPKARDLRALASVRTTEDAPLDVIAHSELAEPAGWRSRNPFARRDDYFGLLGRRPGPNMRLVVLEPAIREQLAGIAHKRLPIAVLPHPVCRLPAAVQHGPQGEGHPGPLAIAFIGGTFAVKGFDVFAEMARMAADRFSFHVVGARADGYAGERDHLFATPPAKEKLSAEDFDAAVQASDLICLPLDPIRYSLAASGTLLDCVAHGKPVLTTRTAVTEDWHRRHGDFGYVVETASDMPRFLSTLSPERLRSDLQRFRPILARIREERSVAALAKTFRPGGREEVGCAVQPRTA